MLVGGLRDQLAPLLFDLLGLRFLPVLMRHLTTPERHYIFGNAGARALEIVVFDESQEALFLTAFESVEAYRVMDDRDLMDHWCDESRAAGTTVKQWGGTWTDEAPLLFNLQPFRYVIKGEDGSIEVVAPFCEPVVRRLAPGEHPFTARASLPDETEQPEPDAAEVPLREGARWVRSKG